MPGRPQTALIAYPQTERRNRKLLQFASAPRFRLISGHESKQIREVYQHQSLESVDKAYQDAIQTVGI